MSKVSRSCRDILRRGSAWFAALGLSEQHRHQAVPDFRPCERPCVVEEEMGIPLRELIDKHCGGVRGGWDNLLAVIPGGSSVPLHHRPSRRST